MPFFRASGGAGGAGVVDCLADINEQLEGLGENEYLVYTSNGSSTNSWAKHTLTSTKATINIPSPAASSSYVLVIVDFSKITFNSVKFGSDGNVNYGPNIFGIVYLKSGSTSVGYNNLSSTASNCKIGIYSGFRNSSSSGAGYRMYFTGVN